MIRSNQALVSKIYSHSKVSSHASLYGAVLAARYGKMRDAQDLLEHGRPSFEALRRVYKL